LLFRLGYNENTKMPPTFFTTVYEEKNYPMPEIFFKALIDKKIKENVLFFSFGKAYILSSVFPESAARRARSSMIKKRIAIQQKAGLCGINRRSNLIF
jgi:hypothetical protein